MNRRILAIDDEAQMLDSYQAILCGKAPLSAGVAAVFGNKAEVEDDFELSCAAQGQEGYELGKAAREEGRPFAAAFIDMRMPPGWDGLETARALRELDERIYIVIVTAHADRGVDELQAAIKSNIMLLRKPFANEEIYQLARNLCNTWERDHELEGYRKDLKKQVELRSAELLQASKLSSLGEMATGVAHELNTPLNVILMSAHETQELLDAGETEEIAQIQKNIIKSVKRCTRVINHIRIFGRRDAVRFSSESVSEILDDTLLLFGKQIANANIELRRDLPRDLPPLRADRNQIEQVFINLLQNSMQALAGRKDGIISVSARPPRDEQMLEIVFTDNGPGIPEKILSKIFDPFFTTKEAGKGTGLGLSISHGIIETHHGGIACESSPGEGTEFVIRLPVFTEN